MKIAIRADASIQIGNGHVMRCLTLADALKRHGGECHFICRELEGNLTEIIRQRGYTVHILSGVVDAQGDGARTRSFLGKIRPDWLVVDHYGLDAAWEKAAKSDSAKLMVIDDLANRPHMCSLLLNQNLGRQAKDYATLVPATTQILAGPRFALVRPDFMAKRPATPKKNLPDAWLACVGGTDPKDILSKILKAWELLEAPKPPLTLAVGSTSPNIPALEKRMASLSDVTLSKDADMAELMANAGLFIGTTGSISWERCCMGLPAVMGITAENQRDICEALVGHRAGINIGEWDKATPKEIAVLLDKVRHHENLLEDIGKRAWGLVDGYGPDRVISAMLGKPIQLSKPVQNGKRVLFLGYDQDGTCLIDRLISAGCGVWHTREKISSTADYDLVISFGYKHILKKDVVAASGPPIVNLHISYLPYNRGYHPNFWSFFDGTPAGVSIHFIDEGVDTGPILYQKEVSFKKEEDTFSKTYKRLIAEIEELFVVNLGDIANLRFTPKPQTHAGTFHKAADLPQNFSGWDSKIESEIAKLKQLRVASR